VQEGRHMRIQALRGSNQDQVQDKALQELRREELLQIQRSVLVRPWG
jgi:hypothetical protein